MKHRDMLAVLKSMRVLIDTREQDTPRARRRISVIGLPAERVALDYGDYSYNATLPDGSDIYDLTAGRIRPSCAIERKMDLDELAQCFCGQRDRFEREWERAADAGARLWLLIENASWAAVYGHRYRTLMNHDAFVQSILAFQCRYDSRLIMCDDIISGKLIHDILYRDLKERLERGEYG